MSHIDAPWKFPRHEFPQKDHGPTYCPQCEAVHENKRWTFNPTRLAQMRLEKLESHLCAGCAMVAAELYEGQLKIEWDRLSVDGICKTNLLNLIRNVAVKETANNPLSCLVFVEEHGPQVEVLTTTGFLATHLGKAIKQAFHGQLTTEKNSRQGLARVHWLGPVF